MSERKTAEFKLRCTPEEKIRWQREAEEHDCSLSELVRTTMNVVQEMKHVGNIAGIPVVADESVPLGHVVIKNIAPKAWMFESKNV